MQSEHWWKDNANQPYIESDSTTFLKQTTEALAHSHAKGIPRHDIRPGNIFMHTQELQSRRFLQ